MEVQINQPCVNLNGFGNFEDFRVNLEKKINHYVKNKQSKIEAKHLAYKICKRLEGLPHLKAAQFLEKKVAKKFTPFMGKEKVPQLLKIINDEIKKVMRRELSPDPSSSWHLNRTQAEEILQYNLSPSAWLLRYSEAQGCCALSAKCGSKIFHATISSSNDIHAYEDLIRTHLKSKISQPIPLPVEMLSAIFEFIENPQDISTIHQVCGNWKAYTPTSRLDPIEAQRQMLTNNINLLLPKLDHLTSNGEGMFSGYLMGLWLDQTGNLVALEGKDTGMIMLKKGISLKDCYLFPFVMLAAKEHATWCPESNPEGPFLEETPRFQQNRNNPPDTVILMKNLLLKNLNKLAKGALIYSSNIPNLQTDNPMVQNWFHIMKNSRPHFISRLLDLADGIINE